MLSGSPLNKDWKTPKEEKPAKAPKILSKGEAKRLVGRGCDSGQCQWIDRWLKNFVQSRSLPPQMAGSEAYSNIMKFMGDEEGQKVIDQLRSDYNGIFVPKAE